MNLNVLGIIVAVMNLSVLVAVAITIRRLTKILNKLGVFENDKTNSTFSELLNRVRNMQSKNKIKILASPEANEHSPSVDKPQDRINLAIEKINRGISIDQIGRELGYSRSEMGILLATARQGNALGQLENASLQ